MNGEDVIFSATDSDNGSKSEVKTVDNYHEMIGHAERPDKVCETVWSLSESRGQGLEMADVEDCRPEKGFSVSVNGGFV